MEPKQRVAYIWDYYKWWIILGILGCGILIHIVYSTMTSKDTVAYLMAVNANVVTTSEDSEDFFDPLLEELGYDLNKEEVVVNSTFQYSIQNQKNNDLYSLQAIQTIVGSGQVSLMMADEDFFRYMGARGAYRPVSDYLTEEQIKKYQDQIIWVEAAEYEDEAEKASVAWEGESEEDGTKYARGIRLENNAWLEANGLYDDMDAPVVGLMANAEDPDLSAKMIQYILGEEPIGLRN